MANVNLFIARIIRESDHDDKTKNRKYFIGNIKIYKNRKYKKWNRKYIFLIHLQQNTFQARREKVIKTSKQLGKGKCLRIIDDQDKDESCVMGY